MKALFNRLSRSRSGPENPRDKSANVTEVIFLDGPNPRLDPQATVRPSEKPVLLPAIPQFKADDFFSSQPSPSPTSPVVYTHNRSSNKTNTTSSSSRPPSNFELSLQKPLPDISPATTRPLPSVSEERKPREPSQSTAITSISTAPSSSIRPRGDPDSQGRSTLSKTSQLNSVSTDNTSITDATATVAAKHQSLPVNTEKKVAFISPPATPGGLSISNLLPDVGGTADLGTDSDGNQPAIAQPGSASKTSLNNGSPAARRSSTQLPPKVNTSTSKSSSKVMSPRSNTPGRSHSQNPSRTDFQQSTVSFRSGTPYSSMTGYSAMIQPPSSWSEAAEEDLVSNLGPRERTRQEVLWEIVTSEQRYVSDLCKLKETFIDPLLHPYATAPPAFSPIPTSDPLDNAHYRPGSPTESIEHLPIASRFLTSPTPGQLRPGSPVNAAKAGQMAGIGAVGYARKRTASEGPGAAKSGDEQTEEEEAEGTDRVGGMPYLGGLKGVFKDRTRTSSTGSGKPPTIQPMGKSPYGTKGSKSSRSHQSLPPPPRAQGGSTSRASLIEDERSERERDRAVTAMSTRTGEKKWYATSSTPAPAREAGSRMFGRKLHKDPPPVDDNGLSSTLAENLEGLAVPPHLLPEDLRICLEVLEGSLKGHIKLCDGLRKRYDEQYPLVRSLADVFVENSHILKGYDTYVLHLEKALEQVENATQAAESTKKPKNQDAADWAKVCKLFKRLEEIASDKGETGLAISLSKPFQRLLKYPLMFQNLLFHTDPSTFEYEATLQMVAEVEKIVRSIEDEKIQKEERDQTRDVFARIEGLEKVKMLAVPKPSRMLVEEKPILGLDPASPEGSRVTSMSPNGHLSPLSAKNVKSKSSLKRLSDVLPSGSGKNGIGGRHDLWLVKFNDVVLRCQRVGTTTLPLATGVNQGPGRSNSLPEKSKYATTGRRHSQMKPRNLYKFVKIETWVIGNVAKPKMGLVSMEDISRSRTGIVAIQPVKSGDSSDEDGNSSDDSDRKSKMSFSYWGADKITVDPVASAKARASVARTSTSTRRGAASPVAYTRPESVAKAKFGNRLRNSALEEDGSPINLRSSSSRKAGASSSQSGRRAATTTDDTTVSGTSRKAAWNPRASALPASPPTSGQSARRLHNQSLTSTNSAAASRAKAVSPAPTDDSGVRALKWFGKKY